MTIERIKVRSRDKIKMLLIDAALQDRVIYHTVYGTISRICIENNFNFKSDKIVWCYQTDLKYLASIRKTVRQMNVNPEVRQLSLNEAIEIIENTKFAKTK